MIKFFKSFLLFSMFLFFSLNINLIKADELTESNEIFKEIEVNQPVNSSYDSENYAPIEGRDKLESQEKLKTHTKAISDQQLGKGVYLEGLNDNIMMSSINSAFCRLAGGSSCLIKTSDGTSYNPYGPSVAQGLTKAIAYTFIPPASGTQYIANNIKNFGSPQKTYAQGLGFESLNPLLPLWKTSRDIAYIFFTIFALIVGFMILFRQKIDGQTSVSVQQAIPSILVSLVLVTFSYAIAGLMIDLMWFSMYFISGFFENVDNKLISMNILGLSWEMISGGWGDTFNIVASMVENSWGSMVGEALGTIGTITMALIIAVVVVIGCFKLFINLLKAYINILISIIFAPLMLMMHAIPGKKPLGTWAKSIFANLSCFPLVFLLLIIHKVLTGDQGVASDGGFIPPYILGFNNLTSEAIGGIIGLAIILTLPDIIDEIRKKFGGNQSFFAQFGDLAIKKAGEGAKNPIVQGAGRLAGTGIGAGGGGLIAGGGAALIEGINGKMAGKNKEAIKTGMANQFVKYGKKGVGVGTKVTNAIGSVGKNDAITNITKKINESASNVGNTKVEQEKELERKKKEEELRKYGIKNRPSP